MTELERLREQNRILRKQVRTLAIVLGEIFNVLPEEWKLLEKVQRAMAICRKISKGLEQQTDAEARDGG